MEFYSKSKNHGFPANFPLERIHWTQHLRGWGALLRSFTAGETGRAGFKTPLEGEAMEVLGCFWAPKMLVLQSNKGKFRHQTWQSDLNSFLVVQTFKTQWLQVVGILSQWDDLSASFCRIWSKCQVVKPIQLTWLINWLVLSREWGNDP